jgi:hypothetical protein
MPDMGSVRIELAEHVGVGALETGFAVRVARRHDPPHMLEYGAVGMPSHLGEGA